MPDVSRRGFLKGLGATIVVASVLPDELSRRVWALGAPIPRLWGDGVHDDFPGLQWLLDQAEAGRQVSLELETAPGMLAVAGPGFTGLATADYHVSQTLRLPKGMVLNGRFSRVTVGECPFLVAEGGNEVSGFHFVTRRPVPMQGPDGLLNEAGKSWLREVARSPGVTLPD